MVSEIRELPNKTIINIFNDADITLIQDSLNYVEIESYSNLVSFIEINTIDTATEIRNLNTYHIKPLLHHHHHEFDH